MCERAVNNARPCGSCRNTVVGSNSGTNGRYGGKVSRGGPKLISAPKTRRDRISEICQRQQWRYICLIFASRAMGEVTGSAEAKLPPIKIPYWGRVVIQ